MKWPFRKLGTARSKAELTRADAGWPSEQTLYKFHPETGQCADQLSEQERQEIPPEGLAEWTAMKEVGGKFYWQCYGPPAPWARVELQNYKFVCDVTGVKLRLVEDRPSSN